MLLVVVTWMVLSFASVAVSDSNQCPNSFDSVMRKMCPERPCVGEDLETNETMHNESKIDQKEILCEFALDWTKTRREKVKQDLLEDVHIHKKRFFRFLIDISPECLDNCGHHETVTLISMAHSFNYMLHYPHNFQTLSLGTLSILSTNVELHGYCDPKCGGNCRIDREALLKELSKFIKDVQANFTSQDQLNFAFNQPCLQIDYDLSDILSNRTEYYNSDILSLNIRDYALPDLLYYWRFLKLFLTWNPHTGYIYSGDHHRKDDVLDLPNYRCLYVADNQYEVKALLTHYWIIIGIGVILWLYSPLLIHFLPSTNPLSDCPKGMFPQYKSPVYLGRLIQYLMCYFVSDDSFVSLLVVRIRRILFLLLLSSLSFRLLFMSHYGYFYRAVLFLVLTSASLPRYLSKHLKTELPKGFPLFFIRWPYPKGLVKTAHHKHKVEYQLLAHVLQERIYLTVDIRFWRHLIVNSFKDFCSSDNKEGLFLARCSLLVRKACTFVLGIFSFTISGVIVLSYFLFPLLFFCKEMALAMWRSRYKIKTSGCLRSINSWIKFVIETTHGLILVVLVPWTVLQLFTMCLLVSEVFVFTCIGATLTPSIALKYITSVTSILFGMYTMVHHLHSDCNAIVNEVVSCLLSSEKLEKLVSDLEHEAHSGSHGNVQLTSTSDSGEKLIWLARGTSKENSKSSGALCLVKNDGITTYVSKDMYFSVLEAANPIRRQVLFLVVKMTAMLFFVVMVLWVKNVYHLEQNMSDLSSLVDSLAVFFIPGLLQLLADKGKFGKRPEEVLAREVHYAIVDYICDLSPSSSAMPTVSYTTIHVEKVVRRCPP